MKDSCLSILKDLEKYFDHEVTPDEKSLIERHLSICPTCQEALKSLEGIRDLIKNPIEEAAQKEDFPWVWQKVQREIQLKKRPSWRESLRSWLDLSFPFQKKVWIPAVAALALLILVTTQLINKKIPSNPNPSVVVYAESQTHQVMVYESEKEGVTVIWLFEGSEKESPPS